MGEQTDIKQGGRQCHNWKCTVTRSFLAEIIVTLCTETVWFFSTKKTVFSVFNPISMKNTTRIETINGTDLRSFGGYLIKPIKVNVINCHALFDGDVTEIARAKNLTNNDFKEYLVRTNEYLAKSSSDCTLYVRSSGYITNPLTEKEAMFPVAFGIVMYKDAIQVEKLLRAIYRPQNFYCIQMDSSTNKQVMEAIESVVKCFSNVFISDEIIDIRWGKISVVQADLACMRTLLKQSKRWKYFINLTGQKFPLKTNDELVEILKAFNGASYVEGSRDRRWAYRYRPAGKPPHSFNPVTGSTHVVLGRPFVQFAVHDQRAKDYLNWTSHVHIPDETFIQTLYLTPSLKIPGAYNFTELKKQTEDHINRYKRRRFQKCRGRIAHGVCILGVDYLPELAKSTALFANKFHWDYERAALECMDELLYNRTRDEYLGRSTFNATWYSELDFVRNQIKVEF